MLMLDRDYRGIRDPCIAGLLLILQLKRALGILVFIFFLC